MGARFLLFYLLVIPAAVLADANDGQFMGYELGTDYPAAPPDSESTAAGDLVIVAENPLKPADINHVKLLATPVSSK